MPNPRPRSILPESWAAKTRCPICGAGSLQVKHLPAAPDPMVCRICQSAFEVEEHGEHLRFTQLAQPLAEILVNRWVTMDEVKEAITRARSVVEKSQPAGWSGDVPVSEPPPGRTLTDDEVLAKAKALLRLGNSPDQVAITLAHNLHITPEQIQAARSALVTQDEQRTRRQNRIVYFSGGAAVVLVVFCLGLVLLAQILKFPYTIGMMSPALPTDIIRAIIPVVIQEPANGTVAAICPMTHSEAARLFGGIAGDWTKKNNGWGYITTPQATVHVPKGMSALLLLDVNLNTVNLVGPATVKNVFAITIYCH